MEKETSTKFALKRYKNFDEARQQLVEKYVGFERIAIEEIMLKTLACMISTKEALMLEPRLLK